MHLFQGHRGVDEHHRTAEGQGQVWPWRRPPPEEHPAAARRAAGVAAAAQGAGGGPEGRQGERRGEGRGALPTHRPDEGVRSR